MNRIMEIESLIEKYGWNEILSRLEFIPVGEFDPVWCKDIKWKMRIPININGKKKWREKNRDNVAWLMENPPHSHSTIVCPKYGTAERRFVITVAPQKDICPQGSTYPRKAVPIKTKIIDSPDNQVWVSLNEENIIPRLMWRYIRTKNMEAPFMWMNRINHPLLTSRIMWMIELNARSILEI